MFLNYLNKKEKLKFLDLAIYMIGIDGQPTEIEKRLLETMIVELEDISTEYSFERSEDIDTTINFFEESNRVVKKIVYLNLVKISMIEDLYNTSEHLFLEKLQQKFDISAKLRRDLIHILYEERDIKEKAKRIIEND